MGRKEIGANIRPQLQAVSINIEDGMVGGDGRRSHSTHTRLTEVARCEHESGQVMREDMSREQMDLEMKSRLEIEILTVVAKAASLGGSSRVAAASSSPWRSPNFRRFKRRSPSCTPNL